jgi:hypothetical protein
LSGFAELRLARVLEQGQELDGARSVESVLLSSENRDHFLEIFRPSGVRSTNSSSATHAAKPHPARASISGAEAHDVANPSVAKNRSAPLSASSRLIFPALCFSSSSGSETRGKAHPRFEISRA